MEGIMGTLAKVVLTLSALVFIFGFGYIAFLEIKDLIKEAK